MSDNTKTNHRGFFRWIAAALTVLFIGLKLAVTGPVAEWSWVWVLSPLWIWAVLKVIQVIIGIILIAGVAAFANMQNKR